MVKVITVANAKDPGPPPKAITDRGYRDVMNRPEAEAPKGEGKGKVGKAA